MGICGQNASHRLSGLRDFTDAPSFALTACFARGVPPNKDEVENKDEDHEDQTFSILITWHLS